MARSWDVFCRVIDNHGDLGVAWRLCADLAARGQRVRLWVDDPSALTWMAPDGHADVTIVRWTDPAPDLDPSDVVVETFGCDPPSRFVQRMAALDPAPRWFNLEYLSAEAYAQRSHGLASPMNVAPGHVLTKRFYFPGFTPRSGGLLREPWLLDAQRSFDRESWFAARCVAPRAGERVVSLFCYVNTALPALLEVLSSEPTLLLVTPGAPAAQVQALFGASMRRGALRALLLPYLTQRDFDHLLWACDLNLVRGEDSFVRTQWAAQPFLWQAYPQTNAAHALKLQAFLDGFLIGADASLADTLRYAFGTWNGLPPGPLVLPDLQSWRAHCTAWRGSLASQSDLVTKLLRIVEETR